MELKHGFGRAAALAALMAGTAPMALMAETPADTLVVADAIDDIVSIDPHEAFERLGVNLQSIHSSRSPDGELHFRIGLQALPVPMQVLREAIESQGIGRVVAAAGVAD